MGLYYDLLWSGIVVEWNCCSSFRRSAKQAQTGVNCHVAATCVLCQVKGFEAAAAILPKRWDYGYSSSDPANPYRSSQMPLLWQISIRISIRLKFPALLEEARTAVPVVLQSQMQLVKGSCWSHSHVSHAPALAENWPIYMLPGFCLCPFETSWSSPCFIMFHPFHLKSVGKAPNQQA